MRFSIFLEYLYKCLLSSGTEQGKSRLDAQSPVQHGLQHPAAQQASSQQNPLNSGKISRWSFTTNVCLRLDITNI